jgi:hypothetical protein
MFYLSHAHPYTWTRQAWTLALNLFIHSRYRRLGPILGYLRTLPAVREVCKRWTADEFETEFRILHAMWSRILGDFSAARADPSHSWVLWPYAGGAADTAIEPYHRWVAAEFCWVRFDPPPTGEIAGRVGGVDVGGRAYNAAGREYSRWMGMRGLDQTW